MKKLLLTIFLSLFISGCDSPQVKRIKQSCLNLGLDKKSQDYKECIKSDDHLFAYSLETNIINEQKKIAKHNNYAEKVNLIDLNINEDDYEEVDFPKFLKLSFTDTLLLSSLKDQYSLRKKIKFKSDFIINFEDNKIDIILTADDPKDDNNSLFFLSNAEFQNVEIQKKIIQKKGMMWFPLSYPPTKRESLIYGYFDEAPGQMLRKYIFYLEDVKMTKVNLTNEEIKSYFLNNYAERNKSEEKSAIQIARDITTILDKIK